CAATIKRITGVSPTLFRAPRGRVDENVIAVTSEQHYTVIGWSICGDHHEAKTPEQMAQRVLLHVHPGAIILLHDGSATMRRRDVQATAIILAALQRRGYRCISVPELLTLDRHKTTIESRGVLPEALDILHDL
ncbi:MAG TPA: polysaccharide deacetylase family protein, partial [Armatimonadota bacterium]|nr:polysaccharide deacetylase family protein [Armatimonadota bacterium]